MSGSEPLSVSADTSVLRRRFGAVPLLHRLPVDAVDELWRDVTLRCTPAGGTIAPQGSPSEHLILLLTGHATLTAATPQGRLVVLEAKAAPAALDKVATFSGQPHFGTLVADETTCWCALPRRVLDKLLDHHPEARHHVLGMVAQAASQARSSFIDMSTQPSLARFARWLLETSQNNEVTLPRPQEQLAHRLGMTRVTLNRALHGLAQADIITICRQTVTILDTGRLRRVAKRPNHLDPGP